MSTPDATPAAGKTRYAIAKVADIAPGACKVVRVPAFGREIEIGVFNVGGRFVAYRNICPHAGAPVCEGPISGTTLPGDVYEYSLARAGEIVRCPWHGWEFDLLTGQHLVDERMKLRAYETQTQTPDEHNENLEAFTVETEGETVFILT